MPYHRATSSEAYHRVRAVLCSKFIVIAAPLCACAGGISGHRVRALRCRPRHYFGQAIAKASTAKVNRLRKVRGFDDFARLSATDTQHAAHRERRAVPNNRDKTILRLWICRHWVFSIVTCRQHHCGGFGRIIGKARIVLGAKIKTCSDIGKLV